MDGVGPIRELHAPNVGGGWDDPYGGLVRDVALRLAPVLDFTSSFVGSDLRHSGLLPRAREQISRRCSEGKLAPAPMTGMIRIATYRTKSFSVREPNNR
jgi:hypothetical protein